MIALANSVSSDEVYFKAAYDAGGGQGGRGGAPGSGIGPCCIIIGCDYNAPAGSSGIPEEGGDGGDGGHVIIKGGIIEMQAISGCADSFTARGGGRVVRVRMLRHPHGTMERALAALRFIQTAHRVEMEAPVGHFKSWRAR